MKNASKAKGGQVRAEKLTPETRSDIAKKAALTRWNNPLPRAVFGSPDQPLKIAGLEIPCYVLNDGRRVIVQRGMYAALGIGRGSARGGGDRLHKLVSSKGVSRHLDPKLVEMVTSPIIFNNPKGGGKAFGYEADMLADLCNAILAARQAQELNYQQANIAVRAEILVRAFAKVGIIALVDEATGYEEVRDRKALQAILDKYIAKEFAAWAKRFPDEFYQHIFRLRGWDWAEGSIKKRPLAVAGYTKDFIYARLAPGVLQQLEQVNLKGENGRRSAAHHQWLTEDFGVPALSQHMHAVLVLFRVAQQWDQFKFMLNMALPRHNETLQLPLFANHELFDLDLEG